MAYMQGCRRTSGAWSTFGFIASLVIFGCTGNLPNGSTGTGGSSVPLSGVPAVHRATAAACSGELAEAGVPTSVYDGGSTGPTAPDGGAITCATDSDCPPCQNGQLDHCVSQPLVSPSGYTCFCDQCNSDQDCGGTTACGCSRAFWAPYIVENLCLAANCRVDADCGPGGFCSPSVGVCGARGYYCHTAADTCLSDTDCPTGVWCSYSSATGAWGCITASCGG
jgi:hypothetical protein